MEPVSSALSLKWTHFKELVCKHSLAVVIACLVVHVYRWMWIESALFAYHSMLTEVRLHDFHIITMRLGRFLSKYCYPNTDCKWMQGVMQGRQDTGASLRIMQFPWQQWNIADSYQNVDTKRRIPAGYFWLTSRPDGLRSDWGVVWWWMEVV